MLISGVPFKSDDLQGIKTQCFIATAAGAGYDVGDQVVKINNHNTSDGALSTVTSSYFLNVTTDTQLATPLTSTNIANDFKTCDDSTDVEIAKKVHTDTITGEFTEIYEVTLYDATGSVKGTPYYILADGTGTPFTPTGEVKNEPVRVTLKTEVIAVTDASAVPLVPPAFTYGAKVQVHDFNEVKASTGPNDPVTGLSGIGDHVKKGQHIILLSKDEVDTFKAIAIDSSAAAELYVEYYNTSYETGL